MFLSLSRSHINIFSLKFEFWLATLSWTWRLSIAYRELCMCNVGQNAIVWGLGWVLGHHWEHTRGNLKVTQFYVLRKCWCFRSYYQFWKSTKVCCAHVLYFETRMSTFWWEGAWKFWSFFVRLLFSIYQLLHFPVCISWSSSQYLLFTLHFAFNWSNIEMTE